MDTIHATLWAPKPELDVPKRQEWEETEGSKVRQKFGRRPPPPPALQRPRLLPPSPSLHHLHSSFSHNFASRIAAVPSREGGGREGGEGEGERWQNGSRRRREDLVPLRPPLLRAQSHFLLLSLLLLSPRLVRPQSRRPPQELRLPLPFFRPNIMAHHLSLCHEKQRRQPRDGHNPQLLHLRFGVAQRRLQSGRPSPP